MPAFDVLIRGGQVLDGTGAPAVRADVGIRGDRIAAVGQLERAGWRGRTIDATGLVVAPGFIDLHTHSEMPLVADGTAQSKVRQGVTLDIIGESTSPAPRDGLTAGGGDGPARRLDDVHRLLRAAGAAGHLDEHDRARGQRAGPARRHGLRLARPATPQELTRMTRSGGAVDARRARGGWSPASRAAARRTRTRFSRWPRPWRRYGGNYTSHIGSEGFEQTKEIAFAIRVAEEAKIPVHIFHFKIRGKENEGTIGRYIKQIEEARARGLNITANQYPYTAMFHGWSAFFPLWIREGGPQQFAERLKDPAARARLKTGQGLHDLGAGSTAGGTASSWPGRGPRRTASTRARASRRSPGCAAKKIRWIRASR